MLALDWVANNCSEFLSKDECPANSSDLISLRLSGLRTLRKLCVNETFQTNLEILDDLKKVLQLTRDQLRLDSFDKATLSFPERLRACVSAGGEHFEHTPKRTGCQVLEFKTTISVSSQ